FIIISYINILIKQYLTLTELLNRSSVLVQFETAFKIIALGPSTLLIIYNVNLIWELLSLLIINLLYLIIYLMMYLDIKILKFSSIFIFLGLTPIVLIESEYFNVLNLWVVQIIFFILIYIINI